MSDDKKNLEDENVQPTENSDMARTDGENISKDVSKEKNTIDFDKEIENLDEFLAESEEEDFILDDDSDEDHILTADKFNKDKKSGGLGKYIAYGAFVILLCGLGYGAVIYAPEYLKNPDLAAFEETMANRTANIMGDGVMVVDATGAQQTPQQQNQQALEPGMPTKEPTELETAESQIPSPPVEEDETDLSMVDEEADPLPMAMDEAEIELDIVNESDDLSQGQDIAEANNADTPVANLDGEVVTIDDQDVSESVPAETAETIADALAIAQSAQNEPSLEPEEVLNVTQAQIDSAEEVQVTDTIVMEAPSEEESVTSHDNVQSIPADNTGIERTRATSLSAARQQAQADNDDNLPPLEDDTIEIANDVMQLPAEDIEDVVEAVDNAVENTSEALETMETTSAQDDAILEDVVQETIVEETGELQPDMDNQPQVFAESRSARANVSSERDQIVIIDIEQEIEDESPEQVVALAKPKTTPAASTSKRSIPEDPRISSAKQMMNEGRYVASLAMYNAILMDDPANTRALTGRQLAQAKIRSNDMSVVSLPADEPSASASATFARTLNNLNNESLSPSDDLSFESNRQLSMPPIGEERTVYGTPSALRLREKLKRAETDDITPQASSDKFAYVPMNSISVDVEQTNPEINTTKPITQDDIVFYDSVDIKTPSEPLLVARVDDIIFSADSLPEQDAMQEPVKLEPFAASYKDENQSLAEPVVPADDMAPVVDELLAMITEAESTPANTALAITIGDIYRDRGQKLKARDWYRKALRNDAAFKTGLNRMSVYDRLAGVK